MWKALRRWLADRRSARREAGDLPDRLHESLEALTRRFDDSRVDYALIGGVAVVMHGVDRMTRDLDFIVDRVSADAVDSLMLEMGFERLHRDDVFGNYLLGPLRIDLLFTRGPHSQRMLGRAPRTRLGNVDIKLVQPDDLIGLKLQALANNASRLHDRSDIALLLERHAASMDMALVREYFRLFDKEAELDELLATIARRDQ